jgi:hypothetical protein
MGNQNTHLLVKAVMAATVLQFDPSRHQKVRYNDQLYAILLTEVDFVRLSPNADVVIHVVSHEKIIFRAARDVQQLYTVKKNELEMVEPHIIE